MVSRTIKAIEEDDLRRLIQLVMDMDNRKTVSYLQLILKQAVISHCADNVKHSEESFWMSVAKRATQYLGNLVSVASAKYHLSK